MELFSKRILNLSINSSVSKSINDLLAMDLDGCIAGSCVLEDDFCYWGTEPDVDFFAYNEKSWIYAITKILSSNRYKPGSTKDEWKLSRIAQGRNGSSNKWITQTIYIKDTITGIYINMSYKPGTSNVLDVLSRFDTIAIMVGICCRTKSKVDLRHAFHAPEYKLPIEKVGDANPIRLWYMAEGWDENTWSRELARIKKYHDRGFDMRSMAESLAHVAASVLSRGEVVGSEKSKARYLNLMMSCYRPLLWLEDFVYSEQPEDNPHLSEAIFMEILELTKDLPTEIISNILVDLSVPLVPEGDKEFKPDEEEGDQDVPEDR